MTILAAEPVRAPLLSVRLSAAAKGVIFAATVCAFAFRISPFGAWLAPLTLGLLIAAASVAYSLTASEPENAVMGRVFLIGALICGAASVTGLSGEKLEPAFGLASLAMLGVMAYRLAAHRRATPRWLGGRALVFSAALIGALFAYNAWYVIASRDLEIADFMFYRLVSVAVATSIDNGHWPQLVFQVASSLKADYSWLPGLLPGAALSLGAPLSRAVYQAAIMAFYAAPALAALGWLARELAARSQVRTPRSTRMLALGVLAVAAAYPTGIAVAARGMPDIGGLALYVYALRLADKLVRSVVIARAEALTRRIALALVLTLSAMFLFRRWYAFADVGIVAMLAVELAIVAFAKGRAFPWKPALASVALAALTGLALVSPVLVDWLPNPAAHDYARIYAAYRKPADVLLGLIGDWWGYAILGLAVAGATILLARWRGARLARLTFGAAIVAAALFLRVQTPYVHHVFLIAPAVTGSIGAFVLILTKLSPARGAVALALLAVLTLTPAGALAPKGAFPNYGQPHAPRSDLAELARMKDWVDARAAPEHKVCGLGSSYTFSGQLIDELWQLKAERSPLHLDKKARASVAMSDVDTVEGAPSADLGDCAFMIVGDPVQTHLIPAYQQTVIVPSREMLEGAGIGTHYARTGEVFHLEKGVSAVVFERKTPVTDQDIAALTGRWQAARIQP
jgi:hypothetical protein